jgi:hypothetical protein
MLLVEHSPFPGLLTWRKFIMNARKTIAVFAVLVLTTVELASAAVNNVNSRGQFVPMGSNQVAARRSYARPSYSGRVYRAPAVIATQAPMVATAPAILATPTPLVATAPTDGRRFSYAPAPAAAAPCPHATATAPTTDGARRFSYAPAPDSAVAPALTTAPRVYSTRPSYSSPSGNHSRVGQFPLLKTDPRKYNTR